LSAEFYARHFQIAPYPIVRGCAATYFPEGNVLVPIDSVAETFKHADEQVCCDQYYAGSGCRRGCKNHSVDGA